MANLVKSVQAAADDAAARAETMYQHFAYVVAHMVNVLERNNPWTGARASVSWVGFF